jgi:hypothetical protein
VAAKLDLKSFRASMTAEPPAALSVPLLALWYAGRGDWERAHRLVQDDEGGDGAWVHAHLHRQEGDLGNAAYWYRLARKPVATASISDEWSEIAGSLLDHGD